MSDEQPYPGIWSPPWLNGRLFITVPRQKISFRDFGVATLGSGGTVRIDRLYPIDGLPNIYKRLSISFDYPDLRNTTDIEKLDELVSYGRPSDVVVWKHLAETWDGDGTTREFFLSNRPALPNATPPTEFPDFPTRILRGDKSLSDPTCTRTALTVVAKTNATIGTGNPNTGEAWIETDGRTVKNHIISRIRLSPADDAPPDGASTLGAVYIPLISADFREVERNYAQAMQEQRAYVGTQIG